MNKKVAKKDYLELRIPHFTSKNTSVNAYLVFTLILFAFLLGVLTDKVFVLGKPLTTSANTTASQTDPTQPTPTPQAVKVDIGHLPIQGDKNAKVTIVEFADFRCPFCERFFTDTQPQIMSKYVNTGKVKFSFRQWAFLGPASVVAANAAECANEQGKFWEFHDYLYKNQPPETDTSMYTTDGMTQIASTLNMDTNQFSSCLSSNKYQKNVDDDKAAGNAAGVNATPTFFVNGHPVVGAVTFAEFQKTIDAELKK